jgi:hypothetical protein
VALALTGKKISVAQIKRGVPNNATAGAARVFMAAHGRPLQPIDEAVGHSVRGAKALLSLHAGVYIARLELEYVALDGTRTNLWHIVVYSVTAQGDRKMSDGFTEMSVFQNDLGKKLSHTALKKFIEDPDDIGVTVIKAWPTQIYVVCCP